MRAAARAVGRVWPTERSSRSSAVPPGCHGAGVQRNLRWVYAGAQRAQVQPQRLHQVQGVWIPGKSVELPFGSRWRPTGVGQPGGGMAACECLRLVGVGRAMVSCRAEWSFLIHSCTWCGYVCDVRAGGERRVRVRLLRRARRGGGGCWRGPPACRTAGHMRGEHVRVGALALPPHPVSAWSAESTFNSRGVSPARSVEA